MRICMGVETEMITTGGEFEFILKLFEESLKFKSNIRWFTSLIGKRENFFCLQNILKNENEIKLLKFSNFKIGKTVRYMIAWSFLLKSEKLVPVKKKDLNPFLKNDLNTENESNTPLQKVKKQKLK
ncbi:hypothetical protein HDU92_002648 [Lobulomyces angularis]|nr:hypothetical protein HDU92_002648 [Lobulomyces angularis]